MIKIMPKTIPGSCHKPVISGPDKRGGVNIICFKDTGQGFFFIGNYIYGFAYNAPRRPAELPVQYDSLKAPRYQEKGEDTAHVLLSR